MKRTAKQSGGHSIIIESDENRNPEANVVEKSMTASSFIWI
jgi:hypothetical protein